jgi:hypothetical protein
MNILAKTAREQAETQRDIIAVDAQNQEFGKKILTAKNLDVIPVQSAAKESIQKISLGGVNPENYNWMNFAEQAFTKTGANPDILAGRGSQSPTLGQEQMVHANASRVVNNMYTQWHGFMTSIIKKLAWKVWNDPTEYIPLMHSIPGVGELPKVFAPPDRVGDFYDFIFKITPYSTQRTNPKQQYQELMGFMTQWVLPTYQFAAEQGAELDIPTVTRILSDYMGFEHFNQWYKTALPHELQAVPYQMESGGNPNKNKNSSSGKNSFGQGNDAFGASGPSKNANKQQQQNRTTGSPAGSSS